MSQDSWHYVSASVQGTSHIATNTPCQDASVCNVIKTADNDNVLIAVASDGAGSAARSDFAAQLTCEMFFKQANSFFRRSNTVSMPGRKQIRKWIESIRIRLQAQATLESLPLREFACTLVAGIVNDKNAVFVQIGDGAAVVAADEEPDEYCYVFWPERGTYANTTWFITEEKLDEHLQYGIITRSIVEIAIFTDGIQNLAIKYDTQEAHNPFFRGLFPAVRSTALEKLSNLSNSLTQYLDSQPINSRTDDDKTLILATRRVSTR